MKYWYITYHAAAHTNTFHVKAYAGESPAQWSIEATQKFDDGPYIVMYAQEITKEQYEYVKGYMP